MNHKRIICAIYVMEMVILCWRRTSIPSTQAEKVKIYVGRLLSQTTNTCCSCPPSVLSRRSGGFSAGPYVCLAVLQTALPSTAGSWLPQTSASQKDCSSRSGAQVGQLQLHPAVVDQTKPLSMWNIYRVTPWF